ncbi:2-methylcitrate dehydratase PrpD [Spinactinospora alkalitolerans]|uniref:2-methylcitrate dehydratase PrpD n=1 Tax=Spinactinospora alkalitolerans TaxID=687207 RepID=A0A852TRP7_9ACTN|nr:MmgE/PrpD family protein [Spinactinospora alkalitolerans]NYE45967.1 2-methylcitrate dehydratase PrpD [Spinactinospora alkalitolerans]
MSGVITEAAELAAAAHTKGLPDDLRDDVARRVLDLLGNCLAAAGEEPARIAGAVAAEWGGRPASTALSTGERFPAASAALVNGTLAHALDFDDTHLPSVLHPSASVIPAALATAEAHGRSGAQLLDAAGLGIELAVRLGMAGYDEELGNSIFFERGLHATAICGAVGSAMASALLQGLDAAGVAHAAGIAASMGSGIIEANRTGGTIKRLHCGWAAHSGVAAADLARHGLTGPPTVVEGRFGFLEAFCGDASRARDVVEGFTTDWELPGIFVKPYPCNHFTHAGVDAALRLRADGLPVEEIADLELGVPAAVLRTIGEPAQEKARPRSGYHAAFSGPYTVAAALLGGGGLGLFHEDFTDAAAADPARLALAAKVRCVPDAECDAIFPRQFPAVLTATLHDGTRARVRVPANRGGPDNPLSTDELATKFRLNAARRTEDADALVALVRALPEAASPDTLTSALRRSA